MTFGEQLKEHRKRKSLSQEKVAEHLGISRQAVAKWEAGQSRPSTENLMALSALYEMPLDQMAEGSVRSGDDRTILHSNLTLLAIIFQVAALNVCIQPMTPPVLALMGFKILPLLACSVWMTYNLTYEKDSRQYRKNVRIELDYCSLQAAVAMAAYYSRFYFLGTMVLMFVCMGYVFIINPRYMRRTLTKRKN